MRRLIPNYIAKSVSVANLASRQIHETNERVKWLCSWAIIYAIEDQHEYRAKCTYSYVVDWMISDINRRNLFRTDVKDFDSDLAKLGWEPAQLIGSKQFAGTMSIGYSACADGRCVFN